MDAEKSRRDFLSGGVAIAGAVALGGIGFSRPSRAQESSETITQLAHFRIGEGKESEAVELIEGLVAAVEEKEPGVLAYMVYREDEDPGALTFFEVYENAAAVANHGQQPHLAELRTAFQSGVFAPPVKIVKLNAVAGVHR